MSLNSRWLHSAKRQRKNINPVSDTDALQFQTVS